MESLHKAEARYLNGSTASSFREDGPVPVRRVFAQATNSTARGLHFACSCAASIAVAGSGRDMNAPRGKQEHGKKRSLSSRFCRRFASRATNAFFNRLGIRTTRSKRIPLALRICSARIPSCVGKTAVQNSESDMPNQNGWWDGYLVFLRSVFSIFRCALRCAFAYFFCAFCCFLFAFWEARDGDMGFAWG